MSVRSLTISGFTSFKQVQWTPARLNILIGPNGSGKSNLLRALDVIRASAASSLSDFILSRGGLPRLLWAHERSKPSSEMTFGINSLNSGSPNAELVYQFALKEVPQSAGFRVECETLGFNMQSDDRLLDRNSDRLTISGSNGSVLTPSQLPETETALSMVSALWTDPVPYTLQQDLKQWAVYQDFDVGEEAPIRRPALIRKETRISRSGENLIPVLRTLYLGDFKDAIDSGMSAAFPDDFTELFFRPTEPDRVLLYIKRKHGSREDSAADLSDGTLRFLLLLTILATPDPPPLIAIDEPESGLHPSMLPIIAEFAAEAATRTQVILSTHSPQMLDAFDENPPAATVFTWVGDHTELKTITGDELKKWVADYSLGRFIFSGEAEAVL